MREFSVLIQTAPDVEGQWTAHCLNWDLVTQGDSPAHVCRMMEESIWMAIEDDIEAGLDPSDRKPAPKAYWDLYRRIRDDGFRVAPADIDRVVPSKGTHVLMAATLYMVSEDDRRAPSASFSPEESVPPPFVIAALEERENQAHQ